MAEIKRLPRRKIGRPYAGVREGEKSVLTLRVTPQTKERLVAACLSTGRNLSQEAEHRLQASLDEDRLAVVLREILDRLPPGQRSR